MYFFCKKKYINKKYTNEFLNIFSTALLVEDEKLNLFLNIKIFQIIFQIIINIINLIFYFLQHKLM